MNIESIDVKKGHSGTGKVLPWAIKRDSFSKKSYYFFYLNFQTVVTLFDINLDRFKLNFHNLYFFIFSSDAAHNFGR